MTNINEADNLFSTHFSTCIFSTFFLHAFSTCATCFCCCDYVCYAVIWLLNKFENRLYVLRSHSRSLMHFRVAIQTVT